MNVVFLERANDLVRLAPAVRLTVERYSHAAVGGPRTAMIRAEGSISDLAALLDWLRVKIQIDDNGLLVWWGYIHKVSVEFEKVRISADMDRVANRIAVAYTLVTVGQGAVGERGTTAWAEDAQSIKLFGYKELLASVSDTTATGAASARDRALSDLALGQAGFEPGFGSGEAVAMIECRGWWGTLNWRYASVPTELALAYETIGSVIQGVGDDTTEDAAQAFDVGSGINLQGIQIYVAKVGSPVDDLTVSICENPDDLNPGAVLASATVAGTAISTSYGWMEFTLSPPLALTAGVSYFLKVSRSGAQSAVNYYALTLDGLQGYGAGPMVTYNGSAWAAYAADMPFRLYSNALVETSQQVKSLITNFGQFLYRVRAEDASGISTESYRDGDTTALEEVERLLGVGTSNNRRMLATVNYDRSVRVYEQEASITAPYFVDVKMNVFDPYGAPVQKSTCPVGIWLQPRDILPLPALTQIGGLQAFFAEEAEYDVDTDEIRFQAANLPNPLDLEVRNG